ncbi:TetR/AcrR family transcriptional regulator [Herbiconiux sp. P18]|uniref:TetR/AcrR family transcriptional regulator n=1 Tax=Herbiconiux liangxiaofengii TaxID=3342795 RepID=UPI0035BA39D7
MRSSSRTDILEAALRVVDAEGGADITYQTVATEAGLTKAGLMYHFPSKDALMVAVIEHVIERWQGELQAALEVPLPESTLAQRVAAFVDFATEGGASAGEFVVFSEAVRRPELSAPWLAYLQEWFDFGAAGSGGSAGSGGADAAGAWLLAAWSAANGLWIAESTGILQLSPAQRHAVRAQLSALVAGSTSPPASTDPSQTAL